MPNSASPPSFSTSAGESKELRQRYEGEYVAWRPPVTTTSSSGIDVNSTAAGAGAAGIAKMSGIVNTTSSSSSSPSPPPSSEQIDPSILPDGKRALSGISTRAFLLGVVLGISFIITIILLTWHPTPLWRLPFFLCSLCVFHFLEFWVTAKYNTHDAEVSSFLLTSNGAAYNIAHGSAMLECFVSHQWLASNKASEGINFSTKISTTIMIVGLVAMIIGQTVRTLAMATAGSSFNHIVQIRHRQGHILITGGIYSVLRHPSYFGFFWWGLGSQMVLQNVVCFLAYALVLWRFFSSRIRREEKFLISFFGDDYITYKNKTPIGIPFIA